MEQWLRDALAEETGTDEDYISKTYLGEDK